MRGSGEGYSGDTFLIRGIATGQGGSDFDLDAALLAFAVG